MEARKKIADVRNFPSVPNGEERKFDL